MKSNTPHEGTKRRWNATHKVTKDCPQCQCTFTPDNRAQVYCSTKCRSKAQVARSKKKDSSKFAAGEARPCHICEGLFVPRSKLSGNAKYCSDDCRVESIKRNAKRFKGRNPGAQELYNRAREYQFGGGDTLKERLYKKYPDLPRCCESGTCNVTDVRILEAAHRPGHERNGAHRVLKYYERHMFWMLCPNCHTYLDLGIKSVKELGLS